MKNYLLRVEKRFAIVTSTTQKTEKCTSPYLNLTELKRSDTLAP